MTNYRRMRISPNEAADIINEERKKWRKFRLLQVRQQSREEAARIRNAVNDEHERQIKNIRCTLSHKLVQEKENHVRKLLDEYRHCLADIGKAHVSAIEQPDPHKILSRRQEENRRSALRRGNEALKQLHKENQDACEKANRRVHFQQKVLEDERRRAKHIANLPTPDAFRKKSTCTKKHIKPVTIHEAGTVVSGSYFPREGIVQKEKASGTWNAFEKATLISQEEEATKARAASVRKKAIQVAKDRAKEASKQVRHRPREVFGEEPVPEYDDDVPTKHDSVVGEPEQRVPVTTLHSCSRRDPVSPVKTKPAVTDVESLTSQLGDGFDDSYAEIESEIARLRKLINLATEERKKVSDSGDDIDTAAYPEGKKDDGGLYPEKEGQRDGFLKVSAPQKPFTRKTAIIGDISCSESHSDSSVLFTISEHGSGSEDETSELEEDVHLAETVPVDRLIRMKTAKDYTFAHSTHDVSRLVHDRCDTAIESLPGQEVPVSSSVESSHHSGSESKSGSLSTQYLELPEAIPTKDKYIIQLQSRLSEIQKEKKMFQQMIDKLTEGHSSSSLLQCSNFYTEEIKDDTSKKRLVKRRDKLEQSKQALIHHYMTKLMTQQESSSSALSTDASCLTLPSDFLPFISETPSDSNRMTGAASLYSDLDECPTKLHSNESPEVTELITPPSGKAPSPQTISFPAHLSHSTLSQTSSSCDEIDSNYTLRINIQKRLLEIQQMKQQILKEKRDIILRSTKLPLHTCLKPNNSGEPKEQVISSSKAQDVEAASTSGSSSHPPEGVIPGGPQMKSAPDYHCFCEGIESAQKYLNLPPKSSPADVQDSAVRSVPSNSRKSLHSSHHPSKESSGSPSSSAAASSSGRTSDGRSSSETGTERHSTTSSSIPDMAEVLRRLGVIK